MIYRAAAALPYDDRERAVGGLRDQLQIMAVAADARPDWSTLAVTGPLEMPGAEDRTRFEWAASVELDGRTLFERTPDPDAGLTVVPVGDATAPLPPVVWEPGTISR